MHEQLQITLYSTQLRKKRAGSLYRQNNCKVSNATICFSQLNITYTKRDERLYLTVLLRDSRINVA
jgi:hypothetical protein